MDLKNLNLKNLAIFMLLVAGSLMIFLVYNMNRTEKSLAHSLIQKPMQNIVVSLDRFFKPIEHSLKSTTFHASKGFFDTISTDLMNDYFTPMITNFPQLSSMGLANSEGFEYDVLPEDNTWLNRQVWIDKWGNKESWSKWKADTIRQDWIKIKEWEDTIKHDPRSRPWYQNALKYGSDQIGWTDPYIYNTTFEPGMTASISWKRPDDNKDFIMAFDLTLKDITHFTQNINVSKNGKVFVLTHQQLLVGLPRDSTIFKTEDDFKNAMLKHPKEAKLTELSKALEYWQTEINENDNSFEFSANDTYWWGKIMKYRLSRDQYFIVGVIIPEQDILNEVQRSKRIVLGSFIFILILTGFVLYSYGESRKANKILEEKNVQIRSQKEIIEHAHNEVRASINYAKRIQKALLETEDHWQNISKDSFILFMPRDVVSGDFYWAYSDPDQGYVFWAAADCTGHGVPGAFMSMLGIGFLNEIVAEEKLYDPGKALVKLRRKIIHSLEQKSSDEQRKDGMDIALCAWNKKTNELLFAGAYNPLFIVRKSSVPPPETFDKQIEQDGYTLYEIRADKMPIGKHQLENEPFQTQKIQLMENDGLYTFSDGYQDQFGGPNGKKFMLKRMKKFILDIQTKSMEDQRKLLEAEFLKWINEGNTKQLDDVCLVGIKISEQSITIV